MRRVVQFMLLWAGLIGLSACAGGEVPSPWGGGDSAVRQPAASIATLRVDPPIGAPEPHATVLARQMSARAAERSIAIAAAGAGGFTHELKGYFSTISEGGSTTVLYVWDVLDPTATRLHRIQGQAPAPGASLDGWSAVPETIMEDIAARTIDALAQWLTEERK